MKKFALFLALMLAFAAVCAPALAEGEYIEAPMLAERVQAGQLPPVEERLPEIPGWPMTTIPPSSWNTKAAFTAAPCGRFLPR